jgi:hypothetical protein
MWAPTGFGNRAYTHNSASDFVCVKKADNSQGLYINGTEVVGSEGGDAYSVLDSNGGSCKAAIYRSVHDSTQVAALWRQWRH